MMRQQDLRSFVKDALECSVYAAPNAPGLTWAELRQIGKQLDYEEGEIDDAIRMAVQAGDAAQEGARLEPGDHLDPM